MTMCRMGCASYLRSQCFAALTPNCKRTLYEAYVKDKNSTKTKIRANDYVNA
jgi:hypothetical protein